MAEEEAKHETSRVGKIFAIDIEISVAKTDSGSKKKLEKTEFAHHNFVKWSFQPYDKLVVFSLTLSMFDSVRSMLK